MAKNTSVLGIYSSRSALENAIDAFREAGWAATDISVLLPENLGPRELATQKETKAPEGATAGAGTGAVIGGALGNLIDRVRFGHVTDFIEVYYRQWSWPAFNLADSAISVGAVLLIVFGLGGRKAPPAGG